MKYEQLDAFLKTHLTEKQYKKITKIIKDEFKKNFLKHEIKRSPTSDHYKKCLEMIN